MPKQSSLGKTVSALEAEQRRVEARCYLASAESPATMFLQEHATHGMWASQNVRNPVISLYNLSRQSLQAPGSLSASLDHV